MDRPPGPASWRVAAWVCLWLLAGAVPAQAGLSVVVTIAQIGEPLREIVGEHGEVINLVGEGVDPHLYRPTRSDMARLVRADAVFWNGLRLEAKMEEVLRDLATSRPSVALAEELPPRHIRGATLPDPHIWMDPGLWRQALARAVTVLSSLAPEAADEFAARAERYFAGLEALEARVETMTRTVPARRRVLVTAHDAFGYFGDRFGFEVVGIQGLSTDSETGLRRIEQIVDMLVSRDIPAVFAETSVSERDVRALIEGAAAAGHRVRFGGRLFSDAMGAPDSPEGTYVGMIEHNARTIVGALGGSDSRRHLARGTVHDRS